MYSTLSTLNTTTEAPLSKAPNLQLLPGRRSINGCPLLRVCVHGVCVFTAVCVQFGWVNCRERIPSMGHRTWQAWWLSDSLEGPDLNGFLKMVTIDGKHVGEDGE